LLSTEKFIILFKFFILKGKIKYIIEKNRNVAKNSQNFGSNLFWFVRFCSLADLSVADHR